MKTNLTSYINSLDFDTIPDDRKKLLHQLTTYIKTRHSENTQINLNFICTHNSRRSQFGQIWGHIAAGYYNIKNVNCFSGGTEVAAFNNRAVTAIKNTGVNVDISKEERNNTQYELSFEGINTNLTTYSKKYDASENDRGEFAAIMTCSHADKNCPMIHGASIRIPLRYEDPKAFDDTPKEEEMYAERCKEIAREILYAFSKVEQ